MADHKRFSVIAFNFITAAAPSVCITEKEVRTYAVMPIREVQKLLSDRLGGHKVPPKIQALSDISGIVSICCSLVERVLSIKHVAFDKAVLASQVYRNALPLLRDSILAIKTSETNRPKERKRAIERLQRVAELLTNLFGTTKQTEGRVRVEIQEISSEELLEAVAEKEQIPLACRKDFCRKMLLKFKKAKTRVFELSSADKAIDDQRPKWRNRPESLRHLTAPLFLKTVYADLIAADGTILDENRIRKSDSKLVQAVQQYISKRLERDQDLGAASGIRFSNKGWNGPIRAERPPASTALGRSPIEYSRSGSAPTPRSP